MTVDYRKCAAARARQIENFNAAHARQIQIQSLKEFDEVTADCLNDIIDLIGIAASNNHSCLRLEETHFTGNKDKILHILESKGFLITKEVYLIINAPVYIISW